MFEVCSICLLLFAFGAQDNMRIPVPVDHYVCSNLAIREPPDMMSASEGRKGVTEKRT